ncbi:hypothetical protein ACS74_14195 [Exiguobacterium acetylicum]|nr:hypothetical protein ACS74_14195 [Exiguobacterium acetylicum]
MDCFNSTWLEYLFYFETDQFVRTMTVEKGQFFEHKRTKFRHLMHSVIYSQDIVRHPQNFCM